VEFIAIDTHRSCKHHPQKFLTKPCRSPINNQINP
jgi:hypothetical protein